MKKLTALLPALIGALCFAFAGCSNGGTFTEKEYSYDGNEIKSIVIDVTDREVEVSASEDNQIYIGYFDSEKEYLDITVSENKELIVNLATNKKWTDYFGFKPSKDYRKIKVRIPDNLLTALSVITTNENIKVNSLSFTEQVNLNADGGNIVCERVNVGKAINLTAQNGDIKGSIIGGWDDFSISCNIKKGDSNLPKLKEDGEKSLSVDCNNGDINIEFVK